MNKAFYPKIRNYVILVIVRISNKLFFNVIHTGATKGLQGCMSRKGLHCLILLKARGNLFRNSKYKGILEGVFF